MPIVIIGMYAGGIYNFSALTFALIGITVWLVFTLYICFRFALITPLRDEIVYEYNFRRIHKAGFRLFNSYKKTSDAGNSKSKKNTKRLARKSISESTYQLIFTVADYYREQMLKYHSNRSKELLDLWLSSYRVPKSFSNVLPKNITKQKTLDVIKDYIKIDNVFVSDKLNEFFPVEFALFSQKIWAELIEEDICSEHNIVLIQKILCELYSRTGVYEALENQEDRNNWGILACISLRLRSLKHYSILIGLVLFLKSRMDNTHVLKTLGLLLTNKSASIENQIGLQSARIDIIWIVSVFLIIDWLSLPISDKSQYIYHEEQQLALKLYGNDLCKDYEVCQVREMVATRRNILLMCAELTARFNAQMNAGQYYYLFFLKMKNKFGYTGIYPGMEYMDMRYRFVMALICNNEAERR